MITEIFRKGFRERMRGKWAFKCGQNIGKWPGQEDTAGGGGAAQGSHEGQAEAWLCSQVG